MRINLIHSRVVVLEYFILVITSLLATCTQRPRGVMRMVMRMVMRGAAEFSHDTLLPDYCQLVETF